MVKAKAGDRIGIAVLLCGIFQKMMEHSDSTATHYFLFTPYAMVPSFRKFPEKEYFLNP